MRIQFASAQSPGGEPSRQGEWQAGRTAARNAVASLLRLPDPGSVEIGTDGSVPTVVRPAPRRGGAVALSLTHCDGRAIAAAATGAAGIGVDLECECRLPDGYTRYFLSPRERRQVLPSAVACWALKEAAWKALALDAAAPFSTIELFWNDGLPVAVRVGDRVIPTRAMLREPWPGYVCALIALREIAA